MACPVVKATVAGSARIDHGHELGHQPVVDERVAPSGSDERALRMVGWRSDG
jgi:hypothetical protein